MAQQGGWVTVLSSYYSVCHGKYGTLLYFMLILITVYPEEYNGERQKIKIKSVIIRYKIKENCFQNWHQCSGTTLRQEKASRREGCRM